MFADCFSSSIAVRISDCMFTVRRRSEGGECNEGLVEEHIRRAPVESIAAGGISLHCGHASHTVTNRTP
jgi:hypothetical protein